MTVYRNFYGAWPTPCSSVDCPGKTPGWGLRSTWSWFRTRCHQKLPKAFSHSSTLWSSTIVRIISTGTHNPETPCPPQFLLCVPCCFLFATMFAFGRLHRSSGEPGKRKGSSKVPAPGTSAVETRLVMHLFCFLEFFLEAIVTFEQHIDKRMFILTAVYLIFCSRNFFCWHLFICHQTPT